MMNERIKQLLKQSTKEVNPDDREWVFSKVDQEKFAKLIALECAKVCNDVGTAIWAEPNQSNMGTAQTCKVAIEKHFGVE